VPKYRLTLITLVVASALATVAAATAAPGKDSVGAVYTLTNSPSGNAVVAYDRAADGTLTPAGSVPTGGTGTGAGLGSQGALVLGDNGKWLLAVNAGSNTVSLFRVQHDTLTLADTAPSGGTGPVSVTVDGDVAYVLNQGSDSISGLRIEQGSLTPIAGSTRPLSGSGTGAAQVQFSPDGSLLAVTEKATNRIDVYSVRDGVASGPAVSPSAGVTPFGFDFDKRGHLIASEAGSGSASSYDVSAVGAAAISPVVATGQAAPCWAVVSKDGRFAYTANGGSGTISSFTVAEDGGIALLDAAAASGMSHPLDTSITRDGRFLFNLTDGSHLISAFGVGHDGSLTPAGTIAVPVGAAGIAVR